MESQPQNAEFKNNPENFHPSIYSFMGLVATKPVFRVSRKARFKPACSATETSKKIEISLVASLDMILSKRRITKVLIRLHKCPGWSAPLLFKNPRGHIFLGRGQYNK